MTVVQEADELTAKENRFLKQTILALRQELERAEVIREESVQNAVAEDIKDALLVFILRDVEIFHHAHIWSFILALGVCVPSSNTDRGKP